MNKFRLKIILFNRWMYEWNIRFERKIVVRMSLVVIPLQIRITEPKFAYSKKIRLCIHELMTHIRDINIYMNRGNLWRPVHVWSGRVHVILNVIFSIDQQLNVQRHSIYLFKYSFKSKSLFECRLHFDPQILSSLC